MKRLARIAYSTLLVCVRHNDAPIRVVISSIAAILSASYCGIVYNLSLCSAVFRAVVIYL